MFNRFFVGSRIYVARRTVPHYFNSQVRRPEFMWTANRAEINPAEWEEILEMTPLEAGIYLSKSAIEMSFAHHDREKDRAEFQAFIEAEGDLLWCSADANPYETNFNGWQLALEQMSRSPLGVAYEKLDYFIAESDDLTIWWVRRQVAEADDPEPLEWQQRLIMARKDD